MEKKIRNGKGRLPASLKLGRSGPVRRGFTLIEVLVVIFIMILAIGLTLASFKDTKPLDEVEAAARGIAASIRQAQNNSLTGKQQVHSGVLSNICRNGIRWTNSAESDKITLEGYYAVSSAPCPAFSGIYATTVFKNVKLNVVGLAGGEYKVSFTSPLGQVESGGFALNASVPAQFKIESTANSNVFALVCVYPTGRVEEFSNQANCP